MQIRSEHLRIAASGFLLLLIISDSFVPIRCKTRKSLSHLAVVITAAKRRLVTGQNIIILLLNN